MVNVEQKWFSLLWEKCVCVCECVYKGVKKGGKYKMGYQVFAEYQCDVEGLVVTE